MSLGDFIKNKATSLIPGGDLIKGAMSMFSGGGSSRATPPAQTETPMPQAGGNVIQAQDQGSVENNESTLGNNGARQKANASRASANANARAAMPQQQASGGRGASEKTHNRSKEQKTSEVVDPIADKVKEAKGADKFNGLKSWAKDTGKSMASDFIKNKANDAIYGTKAEQELAYMDKVFPNTDAFERLSHGSGGALQASTAERVARVNAKTSKKVATIGQTTGALAKANARLIKQQQKTEEQRTIEATSNANWADRKNRKLSAMAEAKASGKVLGVEVSGSKMIPQGPPVTHP